MTARSRRPTRRVLALLLALLASAVLSAPADLRAAETPRRGGVLLAVIGADAPSLDPHQESTFATLQMVAPLYGTLVQIDPYPAFGGRATSSTGRR
jgi:ABC-type oligopeptide transport system substrate-binding subunit